MTVIPLPHRRTVRNASRNGTALAKLIRDGRAPSIIGRQPAHGERCAMCGRTPPSGTLFHIVVDSVTDEAVLVGVGVCHRRYLGRALRALLAQEQALNDPARAAGILRLQQAIQVIG
jgi:hypothetical protein